MKRARARALRGASTREREEQCQGAHPLASQSFDHLGAIRR
jgi:hypothetical protein